MYELTINVEGCTADEEVIVRAWIDVLHNAALSSEVELALSKHGQSQWRANFSVPKENQEENEEEEDDLFAYRVGLIARPGASWSLQIRERSDEKITRMLLEDGDVLTTHKEWLLGTCDTQR
jgi:hypothetical protein